MHEYGVAKSIIEAIETHVIQDHPPSRVKVILNPMYGISDETLAGALEISKKGTKLDETQFDVVLFDLNFTCRKCGKEFDAKDLIWGSGCDNCGSFELTPSEDPTSLGLVRIEVEGAADECLKVEGEGRDRAINH